MRDTAFERKHKLNEYVQQFTDGSGPARPVATNELSTPIFKAPPTIQAEQWNVSVKMPLPYLAGRLNYVAIENDRQPSLKAKSDALRQHFLPKAFPAKAVPRKPSMMYISAENRKLLSSCSRSRTW